MANRFSIRNILIVSVWTLLGTGVVVLLIAAMSRKKGEYVSRVEIYITGVQNNYFIDKKDVLGILEKVNGRKLEKATIGSLDLTAMEQRLRKEPWVQKAELFFDNNNVLQVKIAEREPVVRIFTSSGSSFYMDADGVRLPLSDRLSPRVPVFTNFPSPVKGRKEADSLLLEDIGRMSAYINAHPFWMAQIEQVDITPSAAFELVPKLGNQLIRFGNADKYEEKFNKLLAFYKQVQMKTGWNKYSLVDVQYAGQVVAVRRDAAEIRADSLRSIQVMRNIIAEAKKNTNDSTRIQLPQPDDHDKERISRPPLIPDEADTINHNIKDISVPEKESLSGSLTPRHDPDKPATKNQSPPDLKRSAPSSYEKPGPALPKKDRTKKDSSTAEKKSTEPGRVPKAVMPPPPDKSDY